jgi:hypothetical protein
MSKRTYRLRESLEPTDEEIPKGVIFTRIPECQCYFLEAPAALGIALGSLDKLSLLEVLVRQRCVN